MNFNMWCDSRQQRGRRTWIVEGVRGLDINFVIFHARVGRGKFGGLPKISAARRAGRKLCNVHCALGVRGVECMTT